MGTFFALTSGIFASTFCYTMRRSICTGGSSNGFTTIQLLFCFFLTIFLGPIRTEEFSWNTPIVINGMIIGSLLGLFYWGLGKSLERGPSGLVFAIVNSACVVPALFMTGLFGASFGFTYTLWHALGSLLVVLGLFWAGMRALKQSQGVSWLPITLFSFAMQVLILTFLQWRSLHLIPHHPVSRFLLSIEASEADTEWFLPMMFLGAFMTQLLLVRKIPKKIELKSGLSGGFFNSLSLFFLMLATEYAAPFEKNLLFPISAVTIILLCNGWGQAIYKEKPNWAANTLCAIGVLIPSFFI